MQKIEERKASPYQSEGGEMHTTEEKSNENSLNDQYGYLMHVDNDHVRT